MPLLIPGIVVDRSVFFILKVNETDFYSKGGGGKVLVGREDKTSQNIPFWCGYACAQNS